MSDTTLNRFLASGTHAQRLLFTPAPATPASGPSPLCEWYETDTGATFLSANGGAWVNITASISTAISTVDASQSTSLSQISSSLSGAISSTSSLSTAVSTVISGSISTVNSEITSLSTAIGGGGGGSDANNMPGGRLTLVSATPILTSDQTAKTSIYYTPYVTDLIPIYSGSVWANKTFTEQTLTLDTTNHASGNLYDVFIWNNSGTISIGTGPAWSSTTSRGTGAGTTELQMLNGLWTNKNSITLKNGAGAGTTGIAANTALYVGTFYATANGQTGMAFKPAVASGGTNNFLGVYNAYNRVPIGSLSRESTASWTYAVATWRAANASNSNRITFVDGLQQSTILSSYMVSAFGNSVNINIGVNLDSTSAAPDVSPQYSTATSSTIGAMTVTQQFAPQLGLHYVQAMETGSNTNTITFVGAETTPTRNHQALFVGLDM